VKKLMNAPESILNDALQGFAAAHQNIISLDQTARTVFRRQPKEAGKVALVSGGGAGHEPMHVGYVGRGMLDAACAGEIFSSPTPSQIGKAAQAVDRGAGVLFVVKNYAGDIMNFEMASEIHGSNAICVVTDDDVALLGRSRSNGQGSRGVAGTVVVEKIIGAAAERGASLEECAEIGRQVNAATGSMAAALRACTLPASARPTFLLGEGEIELGVGIHGEIGRERTAVQNADELAEIFVQSIFAKLKPDRNEPLLLLCNGLGATPAMELWSFYQAGRRRVEARGCKVERSLIGNFCTALDMAGASLTITKLNERTMSLWDDPVETPALRW